MDTRALGRSGLQVSPVCLGGNVFGWTADEPTSFRLLDAWVDAGMNFIDTADVYSRWVRGHAGGESETVIGKWLPAGRQARARRPRDQGRQADMGDGRQGPVARLHPARRRRVAAPPADRLHRPLPGARRRRRDAARGDARRLRRADQGRQGARDRRVELHRARASTLALDTSERLGLPRYESLQPLYNLLERAAYEDELEPLCVERGLGVINFFALAMGFLTGKYRSVADLGKSVRGGGVIKQYLNERGLAVLGALDAVAGTIGATPAQVALAWQIARPSITAPIASATSERQLAELVASARLRLDAPAIATIDRASRTRAS